MSIWVKLAAADLTDIKFSRLIDIQGMEGVGTFHTLQKFLCTQIEGLVRYEELATASRIIRVSEVKLLATVDLCLELGLLTKEKGFIYSDTVCECLDSFNSLKLQNRKYVKKFREKSVVKEDVSIEKDKGCVSLTSNLILSNLNINNNINSKVEEFTILTPPETEDEIEAEKHLETPGEGKAWEKDNRWVSAGWRPMKRFPLCWLKRSDLVLVIKRYTDAEVQHRVGAAFRVVQGTLEGRKLDMSGSFAKYPSIVGWLTGYVLSDVLRSETEASRLKRVSDPTPVQRTNYPSASNFVNGLVKSVARSH